MATSFEIGNRRRLVRVSDPANGKLHYRKIRLTIHANSDIPFTRSRGATQKQRQKNRKTKKKLKTKRNEREDEGEDEDEADKRQQAL